MVNSQLVARQLRRWQGLLPDPQDRSIWHWVRAFGNRNGDLSVTNCHLECVLYIYVYIYTYCVNIYIHWMYNRRHGNVNVSNHCRTNWWILCWISRWWIFEEKWHEFWYPIAVIWPLLGAMINSWFQVDFLQTYKSSREKKHDVKQNQDQPFGIIFCALVTKKKIWPSMPSCSRADQGGVGRGSSGVLLNV